MNKLIMILTTIILPIQISAQTKHVFFDFNSFEEKVKEIYTNENNSLRSENGLAIAEIGSETFMLNEWMIVLPNSSGQNPFSRIDSYTKKINSSERGTVLGIRIRFPEWPHSCEALIRPMFPMLPFTREGQYANINNGVVTNVGNIKSFNMWVNGRNFPFTLGVRVRDLKGKLKEFPLGSIFFVGWRKLSYVNKLFSTRIANNILPNARVYPTEIPMLRFDSLVVYRPSSTEGGDFVSYIGASDIEYTPYITQMPNDINDEQNWGLIKAEQEKIASIINSTIYEEILQYEYAKERLLSTNENTQTQTQPPAQAQAQ